MSVIQIGLVQSTVDITPCTFDPVCNHRDVTIEATMFVCNYLNLTCRFLMSIYSAYGDADSIGNGTGMIGAIQRGEFNTSTPVFTATYSRSRAIGFSRALFYSVAIMSTRVPDWGDAGVGVDTSILDSFEWTVWIGLSVAWFGVAAVLCIIDRFSRPNAATNATLKRPHEVLSDRLSSLVTQKQGALHHQHASSRMISISWSLVVLVINSALTGRIFSQSVKLPGDLPYNDFDTFIRCLEENRCTLIVSSLSASYIQILTNPENENGRRILETFRWNPPLEKPANEIPAMILNETQRYLVWISSKYGFDKVVVRREYSDCTFYSIEAPYKESWAFPLRKNSTLESRFDRMATAFVEQGLGQILYDKYSRKDVCDWSRRKRNATTKSTSVILGIFEYFYSICACTAVGWFFVEVAAAWCKNGRD